MLTRSLFARLEAKAGKEDELAADDAGVQTHLDGPIAQALMQQASTLLASPPAIERFDVLGAKVMA